ncbi:uncharacterized protein LOC124444906 isoform X1 [Xenia sp. Carnegie-2017]|uniref:uncharacterized protein LOC124444906 isoform X1 n=1 Tax=Xenia sp. Carnegie-2017 TaxID=2897299 RepID=UPI001F0423E4|nr:uncharacterized protein LOC124444906 isoform X1 [Xenia sp. Carnegie-2017]
MKFIQQLNLFFIIKNQACPDGIKMQYSSEIIEMGDSVYLFVPKHQQDVIDKVQKYFDPAQTVPESLLSRCCRIQRTSEYERINDEQSTTSASRHSPTATQPPNLRKVWPGEAAIENAIPYLKYFAYPKYGEKMTWRDDMKIEFAEIPDDIVALMDHIEKGVIKENDELLLDEIKKLWEFNRYEAPGGGLLHSMRMIIFKIDQNHHFFNRHSLDNFCKFIGDEIFVDKNTSANVKECNKMLSSLIRVAKNLKKQFSFLPEERDKVDRLKKIMQQIQEIPVLKNKMEHIVKPMIEHHNKFITVFDATGDQGGSVVKALLAGGKFKVRGVTRSLESKKLLASQGVDMVQASLDDTDSLHKAISGSYGVFLVTNFWEDMDGAKETRQGKSAVDVCLHEGVKHLIYSGLESAKKKYGFVVDHFDSKGKVEDYLKEKAKSMIWNSIRLSADFNNFLKDWKPKKQEDGTYELSIPMEGKPMYGIDVNDCGECVASVFNHPETYGKKIIGIATDYLTVQQYCDEYSKVFASRVFKDAKSKTDEDQDNGFPGAEEMAAMFKLYREGIERDIELTKTLNPKAKTWEQFVVEHKANLETLL